jgi:hypothetical protein
MVEMQDGIELITQARFEIVAEPLGFWPINYPDRPFEP